MLSKNRIKHIKSLQNKKFRQEFQQFLVEGAKSVTELLSSKLEIDHLVATESFIKALKLPKHRHNLEIIVATDQQLSEIGTFQSNNAALAVVKTPPSQKIKPQGNEWIIALDDVRDPGNLGTIIRMADWYGITKILCSKETAEWYNPKVIAATMGSFLRVEFEYADLVVRLPELNLPVLAADMDGQNVHQFQFPKGGILLMGNEANGISEKLSNIISNRITIPSKGKAESLNVAIATAIVLDNICRTL